MYHGGGRIPIGYDYADGKLIVNPYEAEHVRKIYEWYLAGDSLKTIHQKVNEKGCTNRYASYNSWSCIRNILCNPVYTGSFTFGDILVENSHEPIISKEDFEEVQTIRARKSEIYGATAFQSRHFLKGFIFCGRCGARYYCRNCGYRSYYACYSRTKQMPKMVKDPNCKNKYWNVKELERLVDAKIRAVLHSPELAKELAKPQKKVAVADNRNAEIEKRIRAIDRRIAKLMELYQNDDIPTQILGDNINKLYLEKTALEKTLEPEKESDVMPFDLAEELLANAAQIWDFADDDQKRRIMQTLVNRIIIDGENITIYD